MLRIDRVTSSTPQLPLLNEAAATAVDLLSTQEAALEQKLRLSRVAMVPFTVSVRSAEAKLAAALPSTNEVSNFMNHVSK